MKDPARWSRHDLHQHLQHAVDVEFWTIPLYLTALYSIKGLKELKPSAYPDAAKLVQSVAIQEVLHLELICNISNALGHAPRFHPPRYREAHRIPFIHPRKEALPAHLHGYECAIGGLDESRLKLFCAIELPQAPREIRWEEEPSYDSIAMMYAALKEGVALQWDASYVGAERNTRQKASFKEYHPRSGRHHGFSQTVHSLDDALRAMNAIVEQGEGANNTRVPVEFRPPSLEAGKEFDPGWFRGDVSHYHKFSLLLHHPGKLPEVHAVVPGAGNAAAQMELEVHYRRFLSELEASFRRDGPEMIPTFWDAMFGLTRALITVWEDGACPDLDLEA
ncbi:MAG: ferritin-like domain-containing protein [Candidatus Eiseniibacteriota bacterium]